MEHLCHWLEEHIWLSLVGPKLEVGTKFREIVTYWLSPGHLGWIGTEVIVSLPILLLTIAIRLLKSLSHSRLAS